MAPFYRVSMANAAAGDGRLGFRYLHKLADALCGRSEAGGTAVDEQRGAASTPVTYHPMTNAGDAKGAKTHQTINLTLGILGAVLTGLFLVCFAAYSVRLAVRGELCATYRRKFRCLGARIKSAGRCVGGCFSKASWKRLPGNLKWFFSSQNGCWTCACLRAPKNGDDANNSNNNNNNNNSVSDGQTISSPGGGGGSNNNTGDGSGSPFKSHIGADISHLFEDSDSAFAGAPEPPIEMHPALRRDSAAAQQQQRQQHQHQSPHAVAAPPPARGGGLPVLSLDLPGSSMNPPAKTRPMSMESTYYSGLLEHARPWLMWASSPPPERTLAPAPGPGGGVTRSNRLSRLMEGRRN
ncbi:hypothetical protein GGTG_10935 [Gaeumannomyces tritici R3-111a-1]|uniref:Uncharacterized protein n=1 Tax=Gaeumannomyces tritici (strain R3-111a-1) TaxID=644352 RepID=J3PBR4_GAET3|nr:hypothetical protein GGTG_10935 [Gaeumannomyces tritici R3-111a-1]EJT71681.1 hypothetical protein GGTG_10935 [Gaeumannomyces tritici R3-111a-1]